MATAALKNFLIGASPEVLGHKPALIVAVTSGTGGVYPVAELRMSSYKNNRVCYVPEHIIVRNVREVLNSFDVPVSDEDAALRTRINYALRLLREYAIALRTVRESSVVDHTLFPFGM
jgi:NAD(P)H-dependent FMN reductase